MQPRRQMRARRARPPGPSSAALASCFLGALLLCLLAPAAKGQFAPSPLPLQELLIHNLQTASPSPPARSPIFISTLQPASPSPGPLSPTLTTTFDNNTYLFFQTNVFGTDAESVCRGSNAHLVSITSKAEDDFVYNICTKNLSIVTQKLAGCWIGAQYDAAKGGWFWTDGSDFSSYNIWDRFNNDPARGNGALQPNGQGLEKCTALIYNVPIPGIGYKDWNCTQNKFYVACEIGAPNTPKVPSSPAPPAPPKKKSSKGGAPVALIAGAVGGVIALLAVLAAAIFVCIKYKCCSMLMPPPAPPKPATKDIEDPIEPPLSSFDQPTPLPPTSRLVPPGKHVVTTTAAATTATGIPAEAAGKDLNGTAKAAAPGMSTRTQAGSEVIFPASNRSALSGMTQASTRTAVTQASARESTRAHIYNKPPPGVPAVHGNPFTAAPAGAGAIAAAGLLPACLSLAGGILANADRVVANNARCMQLVGRITAMKPMLLDLSSKLQARGDEGEQELLRLEPMLVNIKAVLDDVNACIGSWTSEGSNRNAITVLRNLMAAAWYQDRFVELNVNLSAALMDLSLALQIPVHHANRPIDRQALEAEAAVDTAKDLEGLVQELVGSEEPGGGPDKFAALSGKDRDKLQQIFSHHGLSLDATVRNARMSKLDSKVQRLMIPGADIQLQQPLGAGGFGTVHSGLWRLVTPVAIKKLQVGFLTERTKADIKREAFIHSEADNHPNVCQLYGLVLEEPDTCMLVMELCARGSLHTLLHDTRRTLTWRQKIQVSLDAATGMAHLHSKQIVHGDVKPSNFLVKDDGRVIVSDFGLSAVTALTLASATRTATLTSLKGGPAGAADGAGSRSSGTGISLWYTPPEVLANPTAAKTPEGDVYAFGMVLLEVATRAVPFGTGDFDVVMCMVLGGRRPQVPDDVPSAFRTLIERCWEQEPGRRPKFADMVGVLHGMLSAMG